MRSVFAFWLAHPGLHLLDSTPLKIVGVSIRNNTSGLNAEVLDPKIQK